MCAKFQLDQSMNLYFTADFAKCVKRRRKETKKKPETLATCILEMAEVIFFKFRMQTPLPCGHFCSKFGFNRIRNHGATNV